MAVSLGINITQNSQSIANCSSNITVSVYCRWSGGSYNKNYPAPAGWLKIDGVQYDFRNTFNDNRTTSGSKTLFSKTLDVAHDSEGAKTVSCSAYFATGVSSGNITASTSSRLTDIPRYARIEHAPDFNDEENPVITYLNPAGEEVSSLQACIMLESGSIVAAYRDMPKDGTSYTFALSSAERNALRSATPNSNTMKVRFCVRSTISGNTGQSEATATMSIVNADPTLSPVVVDTNSATVALTGNNRILVALHSIAKVTINTSALKGASTVSRKVEQGGLVLEGDGSFLVASTDPIRITVTDSRGNITAVEATNEIVPYIDPTCIVEHTMPDGDGEMPLTIVGKAYNGAIGATENRLTVQYRHKSGYGEYGGWVTISMVTRTENDFVAETTVTGLDYKARHTFQARVIDSIAAGGVMSTEKVFISVPVFDWSQDDFNFNVPVYAEKVTGLTEPFENSDATNKEYVDKKVSRAGDTMEGNLGMGNFRVTGLGEPQEETDAVTKAYADGKLSMTLLWENASPASEFAAQTITIENMADYDIIRIIFEALAGGSAWDIYVAENHKNHSDKFAVTACFYDSAIYLANRVYTIVWSNETITIDFEDAKQNGSTRNNRMIPYKIYGMKGVIE